MKQVLSEQQYEKRTYFVGSLAGVLPQNDDADAITSRAQKRLHM